MRFQGLAQSYLVALSDSIDSLAKYATIFRVAPIDENSKVRGGEETFFIAHGFNGLFDFGRAHRALD